nr:CUAEP/CCAEP-tail radical SAM protein [Caldilineaceae bacterium]
GARHITFGDPDFLNGPGHSLKVAQALHREFPQTTFDFTTKVEHILQHRENIDKLSELGASFVVSAFESTSAAVLARLRKGHTVAQMEEALTVLAEVGLAVQPTWLPFTPWTTLDDYLGMLAWIRSQGLIPTTSAVQLSIRLLVPPGSALLDHPDVASWRGELDPANFAWRWEHPDPRMDELQRQIAFIAEDADSSNHPWILFEAVEQAAYAIAGRPVPSYPRPAFLPPIPPRLTENWFC